MKKWRIRTAVAVLLCLIFLVGGIVRSPLAFSGSLVYVSDEYRGYEDYIYRIIKQDMQDGTRQILYESDERIVILYDDEKNVYGAQCIDKNLIRIWNVENRTVVWEGRVDGYFDWERDTLLALRDDELYYCMEIYVTEDRRVQVIGQQNGGQPKLLMQCRTEGPLNELMHYSFSYQGGLAFTRRIASDRLDKNTGRFAKEYVYLCRAGETIMVSEGSYPFWFSATELYFVQGETLMVYDLNTGETTAVKTDHGKEIRISQSLLYASPVLTRDTEYMAYAVERSPEYFAKNPGIVVLSLKDGSRHEFEDLEPVMQSVTVSAQIEPS